MIALQGFDEALRHAIAFSWEDAKACAVPAVLLERKLREALVKTAFLGDLLTNLAMSSGCEDTRGRYRCPER
ncbi:MAG: hypothetical protein ACLQFI_08090 [Methylocella sp.]